MPRTDSGASARWRRYLDGSTAGELIPELVRQGLQQLIELEVAARARCRAPRAHRGSARLPQRQPAPHPHYPGGRHSTLDPQTPLGKLLPDDPRAQAADRSGPLRGDHGGLGQGHLHPQGGCPGGGDRIPGRHLPLGGEPHLSGARRPDPGVPGAALDGSRYPYLYLDATYLHGRLGKTLQVCSRAVVVAMGVNAMAGENCSVCRWATAKASRSGGSSGQPQAAGPRWLSGDSRKLSPHCIVKTVDRVGCCLS